MPTPQVPAYASPQTGQQIRRSAYLADALKALSETPNTVYNTGTGTNLNILANAILGYSQNEADAKADAGIKADRSKLQDALIGSAFPNEQAITQQQLDANAPFDLTPAGEQKRRQAGSMRDLVRAISEQTGDPFGAVQYGQGLQQQEQARQDKLRQPVIAPAGSEVLQFNGAGGYDPVFNVPDPSRVAPGNNALSVVVADDGTPHVVMRDASEKPLNFKAKDNYNVTDVGGVPTIISGREGTARPVTTAEQVGTNKATAKSIETKAEATTKAELDLPSAIANAQRDLSVMQQLKVHPGFAKRYGLEGVAGQIGIMAPGGQGADAQALLEQVTGDAFLSSVQGMRGLGPLSDREGAAVVAASTRLKNHMQSPAAAAKALDELILHYNNVYLIAQRMAGAPIDYSQLSKEQLQMLAAVPRPPAR